MAKPRAPAVASSKRCLPRFTEEFDGEVVRIAQTAAWPNIVRVVRWLNKLDAEFNALPSAKRTPSVVRHYANRSLVLTIMLDQALRLGQSTPLLHLLSALDDLEQGRNNQLLVVGELAKKVPRTSFSFGLRQSIRRRAAAIVEFLLAADLEPSQAKAVKRVTNRLRGAGYSAQGASRAAKLIGQETIKTWHNQSLVEGSHRHEDLLEDMRLFSIKSRTESLSKIAEEELEALERLCRRYRLSESYR